jgi:phage terminase large subunit-like protein
MRSQQFHVLWMDELAKWRYQNDIWDQVKFIMRLTRQPAFTTWVKPIIIIGTTPRPTKLIKALKVDPKVITTTTSSFANNANLDPSFIEELEHLRGTRLGRQEIEAEMLADNPNGVEGFTYDNFERNRIDSEEEINEVLRSLVKVVVAIDPATTANKKSDFTGIIVAGKDAKGHGYVIRDATMKGTPLEWAQKAVDLYHLHDGNCIVAETNQGGDMVKTILNGINRMIPFKGVHASRGKVIRAEPIGSLYAQNRIHHLGVFDDLEQQMVNFNTELPINQQKSPDRMDALVWAFTFLLTDMKPQRSGPSVHVL